MFNSGHYAAKYLGGYEISKQRRLDDDTPGPIQAVAPDRQRRALGFIVNLLVGDEPGGSASFLPSPEDLPNLAVKDGVCEGLEQYCYSVFPVDILSEVNYVLYCCTTSAAVVSCKVLAMKSCFVGSE